VRADNGDPLPGARVAIVNVCVRGRGASTCASAALPELTSGGDGRFEHREVPPGACRLSVARSGYVTQGGSVGPAIGQVEARIDAPVEVTIALSRSAVVAGRVTDDRGNDIEAARVSLRRWRWQNGKRVLSPGNLVADETDDRGQFRLFGIPAGTYRLVAEMVNPVGPEPAATPFTLEEGEQRVVSLSVPVP
jgi:Carboxypeptidase regulatory-like domain